MAETTVKMIDALDVNEFPSNVTKEYYDVIRELISIVALLDGYKSYGENAHKILIEYMDKNYNEFDSYEISLIDGLRIVQNKISYDGFFVKEDYITRKIAYLKKIIAKLKKIIQKKLNSDGKKLLK